jgi:hypothetical protein
MTDSKGAEGIRMQESVDLYCKRNPAAERWAAGYRPINHTVTISVNALEGLYQLDKVLTTRYKALEVGRAQ